MRPMLFPKDKVNQRLPSGPAVMPKGPLLFGETWNSVMLPLGVMRPMMPTLYSVNHRLPSGPAVMLKGMLLAVGMGNPVMVPLVVIRPISFIGVVNHRLPSGPAVMPTGSLSAGGMENSVMVPAAAQTGAVLRLNRPIQTSMAVSSAVRCDRRPERFMLLPPWCMRENVSDGKRPTGNETFQDRSVDRNAELLGDLHACVVRYGLGKRERPFRWGSAADGGPPI